jgi:hypothetical protein
MIEAGQERTDDEPADELTGPVPHLDFGDPAPTSGDDGGTAPRHRFVRVSDIARGTPMRVPDKGGDVAEAELAAANDAARAASIEQLQVWLPGYDVAGAAQNTDDRRFQGLYIGEALLDFLDAPAAVDEMLTRHDQVWGLDGVSFTHGDIDGHSPPPPGAARSSEDGTRGRLDIGGFMRAIEGGWTAIINGAQRYSAPLAELTDHLTRVSGARTNTNIYVSAGTASVGFGAHWDQHDTVIVPVQGAKRWTIFEPSVLSAQQPWTERATSGRSIWSEIIEPGDALVIPRGWGHRVENLEDLSIHYTIGMNRLEVHQLFDRIAFESGYWPAYRADVPYDPFAPVQSYGGSVFDEPQGLAESLAGIATPALVRRAIASHRARLRVDPVQALAPAFRSVFRHDWTGLSLRIIAPGGVMYLEEDDEHVVVAFDDRAVQIERSVWPAFVALAAGAALTVEQLPPVELDGTDQRAELARELVVNRMATVTAG